MAILIKINSLSKSGSEADEPGQGGQWNDQKIMSTIVKHQKHRKLYLFLQFFGTHKHTHVPRPIMETILT